MSATLRRIIVLLSGAALAVMGSSAPASASVDAAEVSVPPHVPTTTELQLLGRTSNGAVAVIRNGGAVLTGHPGEDLVDGGASVDEPFPYSPHVHDLTGNTLRWAEPRRTGTHWVIHTVDVTGGRTTHLDSPDRVVALTGDGWVGWGMARLTLVRHVPGARDRTLLTGVYDPQVVADDRGAAALYYPKGGGARLVLVDFASGRVETLTDYRDKTHPALNEQWPGRVTLTPRDVVWTGWNGMPLTRESSPGFHRRPRAGGAVTTRPGPPVYNPSGPLAATDDRIVLADRLPMPLGSRDALRLWSLTADAWQPVSFPNQDDAASRIASDDFGGFAVDGDGVIFAVGGAIDRQVGVYAVGSTSVSRIATVAPGAETVSDVSLDAGRLTWTQRAVGAPADRPLPVWQAAVNGNEPTLGPAEEVAETRHVRGGTRAALTVSGQRLTVLGSWFFPWQGVTYSPHSLSYLPRLRAQDRPIRSSGRYVLADDKVYDGPGEGEPRLDLTAQKCLGTNIFGAIAACSRADGSVLAVNAAKARSSANPAVIRDRADGAVAVWGTGLAWHRDDDSIAYQATRGAPVRSIPTAGEVRELHLTEGTLSWEDGTGRIMLLDLEDPASTPTASGLTAPGRVDDHLVAGLDPAGRVTVKTLPFGLSTPHPPRLVSAAVARSFTTPRQLWQPEFEVSKAVTDVKLTVRRGRKAIATLTGTGTAGDVRGLSWNGRGGAGVYTYELTAKGSDGEGALTPVSGVVTVR